MTKLSEPLLPSLLEQLHPKALLIIDIDSTLVHTHHRNQAIIDDFCREMSSEYPKDVQQLQEMECRPNDYGYYSALTRHDVSFSSELAQETLQNYWRKRFFSSDYLHHDRAVPGAATFLQTLKQSQHPFLYLTGRYVEPMTRGTLDSFEQLGFPFESEQVILKADPQQKDELYKSEFIAKQLKSYQDVYLIDNEPVILQQIAKDHPQVTLIWFESTHSGRATVPEKAYRIDSFL